MSLKQRINDDLKAAMRAKDAPRLSTLRMIRADILNQEKAGAKDGGDLPDEQILQRLATLAKQRREAADAFREGGRAEMAEQEEAEEAVIKGYLPAEASADEIAAAVEAAIAAVGASGPRDMGKVMGKAVADLKASGKSVDGGAVSKAAKERLAGG